MGIRSTREPGIDQKLTQLELELDQLRVLYEKFFTGQARLAPFKEHETWKRKISAIQMTELSTAPYKFRHKNLSARHLAMAQHWDKVCKEIEEGTYKRDKFLLEKKEKTVTPPTAPSKVVLSDKEKTAIEKAFETVEKKRVKGVSKENFFSDAEIKISEFKKANPNQAFALKLQKDKSGNVLLAVTKR